LEGQLTKAMDEKSKSRLNFFDDFLFWLGRPFVTSLPQPRYAVSLICTDTALRDASSIQKQKYVVESEKETILKFKATLSANRLPKAFPFISKFYNFDLLDSLTTKDDLTLEFGRFSEFPLTSQSY